MKSCNVIQEGSCLQIKGPLCFETVMDVFEKSLPAFQEKTALEINLSWVTTIDSAGLALFINWFKLARFRQVKIEYSNIPTKLTTLAKINGVMHLLSANIVDRESVNDVE